MTRQFIDLTKGSAAKVLATPRSGSAVGATTAWELTAAAGNLDTKWVAPKARAALAARTVKGTAEGWSNTVTFPHVGGDVFTVRARAAGAGGEVVKEVELATVRTIPMTIYYVDDAAKAVWAAASNHFMSAFLKVGVAFTTTWVKTDKDDFQLWKGPNRTSSLTADLGRLFADGRLPAVSPAKGHLRLFVVKDFVLAKDSFITDQLTWAVYEPYARAGIEYDLAEGYLVAQDPFMSARLTLGRQSFDLKGNLSRISGKKFRVKLAEDAREALRRAGAGALRVDFETENDGHAGWSDTKNLVVIGSRTAGGEAHPGALAAKLAMHEVGHAFGQVVKTRVTYPGGSKPNPKYYIKHGGVGPHCQTNAEPHDMAEGDMEWIQDEGPLCVMFHDYEPREHIDPAFCEDCQIHLKLADLRAAGPLLSKWTS